MPTTTVCLSDPAQCQTTMLAYHIEPSYEEQLAAANKPNSSFQFNAPQPQEALIDTVGVKIIEGAQIMIVGVSLIAFVWVAYCAVAKFRECQSGQAEWAELMVLAVAAAGLLAFVSVLLVSAGGFV